ncbi:hypothetical protein SsS58_03106 [Streptomyces scabiei]|uniref:Uncharacterized protein n=1 Tax=Streptomyces scabiei TaxID=1930 RepID=A0A117EDR8_STRSC|nr:hypothetical protein SsS58_03106 [Streptomyces scabiei]
MTIAQVRPGSGPGVLTHPPSRSAVTTEAGPGTEFDEARAALLESLGGPYGTTAYAGRWERSADGAVLHHVRSSHHTPWVGTILKRDVQRNGDDLDLTTSSQGYDVVIRRHLAQV